MFKRIWALAFTKFLTTFNDNAFKATAMFLIVNSISRQAESEAAGLDPDAAAAVLKAADAQQAAVIALGSILFLLPFVVFPTLAGWVSDRFPKSKTLFFAKVGELGVMSVGVIAICLLGNWGIAPLLVVITLMALQSTFFSPAFYGILPETFEESELSRANGILELIAFVGIILGAAAGAMTIMIPDSYYQEFETGISLKISLPFIVIAIAGIVSATFIQNTNQPLSKERFGIRLITNYIKDFKYIKVTRPIFLCVMGQAVFLAFGSLLVTSILTFGRMELGISDDQVSVLQVVLAVGIGLGCFVAGSFSGEKVEFGLCPIGSLGLTVFFINLALSHTFLGATVNCFFLGFTGGLFFLPLSVYVQEKTAPDVRGKTLATVNAVNFIAMLGISVLLLYMTGGTTENIAQDTEFWTKVRSSFFTMSTRDFYLYTAVFLLLSTLYVFYILPASLVRMIALLMTRVVYKINVIGREKIPKNGPALLISNHVSFVDGLLISAVSSREIHFIMAEEYYEKPLIKIFAKMGNFIPISSDPGKLKESIRRAQDVLKNGEVLCIFPEGRLTTNGNIGEFKKGFSMMIPHGHDVPVIPVHLGLLWGSIFSRRYSEDKIEVRKPARLPYPVSISIGDPLDKNISPYHARLAIAELAADAEINSSVRERVFQEQMIKITRSRPFLKQLKDSNGTELTNLALLIKSYVVASLIRARSQDDEEYIGIILPTSTTSVLVNFAIGLTDRIPVFLNFTASSDALDYAIEKCKIKQVYTSRKFIGMIELDPREEFVYLEDVMKTIALPNKLHGVFAALLLPSFIARRIYFPKSASSVHNTATVLFSSGSTGTPKGVVLTHHNFSSNLNGVVRILGMDRDEVILGSLPFFHSFGYMATMWLPLYFGVSVVYHPNPMDAENIGKLVEQHGVGILFATPTFLQAYTRKCTPEQMKSLKLVITGAEKLRQKVSDRFAEKFDCMPIEGYGCTELSPVVSINLPKSLKDAGKAVGKEGSIGQAIPGVVTKTVDPDTGELCDVDQEGLLLVKGPNVLKEYLGEPEKTVDALKDGWYNTGDIAKIDADGYMYITGRLSRFSKIGGEMVPHGALEDEIHAILNATETLVVVSSTEDAAKGERLIILHLEISITPQDIIKGLQDKGLPNLWIPKANSFMQIENIPVLGSGKLDLKAIKDIATGSND